MTYLRANGTAKIAISRERSMHLIEKCAHLAKIIRQTHELWPSDDQGIATEPHRLHSGSGGPCGVVSKTMLKTMEYWIEDGGHSACCPSAVNSNIGIGGSRWLRDKGAQTDFGILLLHFLIPGLLVRVLFCRRRKQQRKSVPGTLWKKPRKYKTIQLLIIGSEVFLLLHPSSLTPLLNLWDL